MEMGDEAYVRPIQQVLGLGYDVIVYGEDGTTRRSESLCRDVLTNKDVVLVPQ